MSNPTSELYRGLFKNCHEWLEGTSGDLTNEQAAWQPGGEVVPAGAHYVHHVGGEDFFVQNLFRGQPPLAATSFAGTAGFDEMMPMGPWQDWARRVTVDMPVAHAYAQAVYAATDAYLADLTAEELARELDLTAMGFGVTTVGYMLNAILIDGAAHCGEISCIKGLQGLQGYPF